MGQRAELGEVSFHDGHLDGILLEGERQCRLRLRTVAGNAYWLVLRDVRRLRADEFREGNIIFGVDVHEAGDVPDEALVALLGAEGHADRGSLAVAERERMTRNGEKLVEVGASYGCRLVAVCRGVELMRE